MVTGDHLRRRNSSSDRIPRAKFCPKTWLRQFVTEFFNVLTSKKQTHGSNFLTYKKTNATGQTLERRTMWKAITIIWEEMRAINYAGRTVLRQTVTRGRRYLTQERLNHKYSDLRAYRRDRWRPKRGSHSSTKWPKLRLSRRHRSKAPLILKIES